MSAPQIIAWEDVRDGQLVWFRYADSPADTRWQIGRRCAPGQLVDGLLLDRDEKMMEFARADQQPGEGR